MNNIVDEDIKTIYNKIKRLEDIDKDVSKIQSTKQTDLNELDKDIENIKNDINSKKEEILNNQLNEKFSTSKIKLLDDYIEQLDKHRKYINSAIEGQKREKNFELLQKSQQEQVDTIENKLKNCDKYERFYNEVESLYNNLTQKYDPTGEHSSIMKARSIGNGDKIIITAETTDDGRIIDNSVEINKETKTIRSVGMADFEDDDNDWNDDYSSSSIETIESGKTPEPRIQKIISPEENAINVYIKTIEQIYNLSEYILNKIESIDAVKLGRIQPTEDTAKFTNKIYEIIEVFQRYILKIFSNIDIIKGNIIYYNIFDIIKKNDHKNELISKQTHFINSKKTFNGNYKNPIINPIIRKDFQRVLQQEKEFLRIINGECKYLYDIIEQNENMINEKYIDDYTIENEQIIENINKKINDVDKGFDDLYKIIFSDRPKSAQSYTNSNIMGSNNKSSDSKDDTNIPFSKILKTSDFLNNDNLSKKKSWFGGSNNKKKYTIKRHPNKKYTISKKMKNARLNKTRNRNIRNKNKTKINRHI